MSVFFQQPYLLGLLALAGLPVLVHLISRARPPVYRFSNIDFLQRILRRTARVRRPKDWLLLALRTLALAAFAAAFASPFLITGTSRQTGGKSTVILLVDRSASMAAREGAGSRFETACAEAARFLDASKPSAANIIWIDADPDAAFPEPGPNLTALTDILKQAHPRPEAGAIDAAFDTALRQLSNAPGRREIVILSDFQASAWKHFAPTIPPGITLHTRRVATSSPPNLAVTSLISQPAEPLAGLDVSFLVRVKNFSKDPVKTQLTLDASGARQTQSINLPAWGEADSIFTLRPSASGSLPVTANIEADSFPADDTRHTVVPVRDSLRITLEMPQDSSEANVLKKAADALSWLELADPASTRPPDIRWISLWNGENPDLLRIAAESGTTVIVRPSPSCPPGALKSLTNIPVVHFQLSLDARPTGWAVTPDEAHPAMRIFRNGDFGNPFAGVFRERLKISSTLSDVASAHHVAHYTDGTPAIVEIPTETAPILLFNLTLDPAKTDWISQGVFLPTLGEILLRTRPNDATTSRQTLPGSPLSWNSPDPAHANAITLIDSDQKPMELTESQTATGIHWQSKSPAEPGIHSWLISGQPIDYSAVNFPDSESDLRPLESLPNIGKLSSSPNSLIRQAALARGVPLWRWLVLAALIFLTLESLIHSIRRKA